MIKLKNIFLELPKKHQMLISGCSLFLLILLVFPSEKASASRSNNKSAIEVGKVYQLAIPEETQIVPQQVAEDKAEEISWQTATVKSGDSLGKIFKRFGFSAATTYAVDNTTGGKSLRSLKVGDEIKIASNDDGDLIKLKYPMSLTDTLIVNKTETGFSSTIEQKQIETRIDYAQAKITSNFWSAALAAGLSNNQTMNLANVFGWDIDFALDIRGGDSFTVMFENQYVDGDFVGHGNILAAEFSNQGETFKAIRFKDGEYYAANGDSMRKAFLRAPVNFKYISSNFNPKRFHPVQKRWKAHRGTDYAAKTGTPVVAAGNGRVVRSSYDRNNGHHVFIQHGNGIETKYIHFSKRAVKKGARVKQGQVIGYVGSTGLAAGPHLHYEFLLNGVHRNPRTVKLPDALPIDKKYKTEFSLVANNMLSQLDGSKQAFLAATDTAVITIAE